MIHGPVRAIDQTDRRCGSGRGRPFVLVGKRIERNGRRLRPPCTLLDGWIPDNCLKRCLSTQSGTALLTRTCPRSLSLRRWNCEFVFFVETQTEETVRACERSLWDAAATAARYLLVEPIFVAVVKCTSPARLDSLVAFLFITKLYNINLTHPFSS